MGSWLSRFVGISMFLALSGAFFTLMYSPLKQIIEGTPAKLWPGRLGTQKDGMPVNAMWAQGIIVCLMILMVAFGGNSVSKFFDILTAMTNVAMTLPYMFIAAAFVPFKRNSDIHKPYIAFKSNKSALIWTIVVMATVGFANFFSIIEPAIDGDMKTTIYSIAGPLFFSIAALLMYMRYEKAVRLEKKDKKLGA
jgi:amino acid transporter